MTVAGDKSHDVKFESSVASPTTTLELMLALDKEGLPKWREFRLPPFASRQSQGAVDYAHYDPDRDLVWSQKSWHDGALAQVYHKDGTTDWRYLEADGCDLRWEGVATLGMTLGPQLSQVIPNAGWETGAAGGWTLTAGSAGGSISVTTTAPRTGTYHLRLGKTAAGTASQALYAVPWSNNWRSRVITFGFHASRVGAAANRARVLVSDGVLNSESVFSNNPAIGTYTWGSVTHTVDAAATKLELLVTSETSGDAGTWDADDMIFRTAAGDLSVGFAEAKGKLCTAVGPMVMRWDETNDFWESIFVHSAGTTATDIVSHNDTLYVAFGYSASYVYSTDVSAATPTFTTSTRVAPADKAGYWAVRRDSIWKSQSANTVTSTTDATNGAAAWATALNVGSTSSDITRMYAFQDSIVVGKENGLHLYLAVYEDGTSANLFLNVTEEFLALIDTENFARGAVYKGNLYMTTAQQGLYIFDGSTLVDATQLMFVPLAGHTGRVRALTADPSNLWMLVDVNTADATSTKEVWLYSLRERQGRFYIHTTEKIDIGDINALAVNQGYLYAIGRAQHADLSAFTISTRRWTLPTKSIAPAYDATPAINTGGNFVTYVWDGGLPDENKAFISLTIFTKPSTLDTEHTILVAFRLDSASAYTTLGTFSGTGAIQTKFFETVTTPETNAVGRAIQLRFTFASDDTVSPELYAFALHSTLRPTRVRTWEMFFQIGEGVRLHNGLADPEAKATKQAALRTLEAQTYPIRMSADLNQDGTAEYNQFAVQIIPGTLELVPTESRQEGVEVWRVVVQEVTVA